MIDPVTRMEPHLPVEASVESGRMMEACLTGSICCGYEQILKDHEPRDAILITQRICCVCPVSHAIASAQCLDRALGACRPTTGAPSAT